MQRKVIEFTIEKKVVRWFDEIWKDGVQILPKDNNLVENLIRSRKLTLKMMAKFIIEANSKENLKEYLSCKTDEELAKMIMKEAVSKGLTKI